MADGGPPTPPVPPAPPAPQPPPIMPPVPSVQLPTPPAKPIPTQPIQPAHVPQLNWSHYKPEFAGKPDEDAEAHLLRMNDWKGHACISKRWQDPTFLLNISRRSKIMV